MIYIVYLCLLFSVFIFYNKIKSVKNNGGDDTM